MLVAVSLASTSDWTAATAVAVVGSASSVVMRAPNAASAVARADSSVSSSAWTVATAVAVVGSASRVSKRPESTASAASASVSF